MSPLRCSLLVHGRLRGVEHFDEEGGQTYAALAIYGDDGTSPEVDGLLANEAFSLGLYLLASDTLLPYISPTGQTQLTGWLNSFGAPLPDYSDASVEFAFYLDTQCNDEQACNYAPGSDSDDDCILPEAGYDCAGACVSDQDGDGVCDEFEILGCTIAAACNFGAEATEDDGSCLELDECGVCGGEGIAEGACDCEGNTEDALGICGGDCEADFDNDGVCDDIDECVGDFDACGVCNGPGEVYACGCNDIPLATAAAKAANWTPSACAAVIALPMSTRTTSVTTWTTASAPTTPWLVQWAGEVCAVV